MVGIRLARKLGLTKGGNNKWPVRLSVRTLGFQPRKRGSTPLRATSLLGSARDKETKIISGLDRGCEPYITHAIGKYS